MNNAEEIFFRYLNEIKMNKGHSITAEFVAGYRALESKKPENERVCYDPYAISFLSSELINYFINQSREKTQPKQSAYLRVSNSILARTQYFDDVVKSSVDNGLEQLVTLGAGYDTRAYRIEGIENVRVFELDHAITQHIKIGKIIEIFGTIPNHVTHVPADLELNDLDHQLSDHGYNSSKKTLFLMEGLTYYMTPLTMDKILFFILEHSPKGSALLFDYHPRSMIEGTCKDEIGRISYNTALKLGEPHKFGINDGEIEKFLIQRGFSDFQNITSADYKKMYFHGKNKNRPVNNLLSFAYAVI